MGINARLDDRSAEQVEYLVAATGQSISDVPRERLAHYHAHVKRRTSGRASST
jgi:hypothetical protein